MSDTTRGTDITPQDEYERGRQAGIAEERARAFKAVCEEYAAVLPVAVTVEIAKRIFVQTGEHEAKR